MISIVFDEWPLSGNPLRPADYGDFCAARAVAVPLLGEVGSRDYGTLVSQHHGEARLALPKLTWSDGEPLRNEHLLRRFVDPIVPRWVGDAEISFEHEQVVATWRADHTLLLAMLRLPDWAPRRPESNPFSPGAPSLGPYCVSATDDSTISLEPNPHWPDGGEPIRILVELDPMSGVAAFERGEVDLTCGTTMTAELLADLKGHPALVRRPSAIEAYVEFGRGASDIPAPTRRGVARAVYGADLQDGDSPLLVRNHPRSPSLGDNSATWAGVRELIYADFPPNGAIVERLADACDRAGTRVAPVGLSFQSFMARMIDGRFDLAYVLKVDHLTHPIFEVGPWYSRCRIARSRGFASTLLDQLIDAALADGSPAKWKAAIGLLDAAVPRIRVGRTQLTFLSRVGQTSECFDRLGCPVLHKLVSRRREAQCQ